MKNLLNFGLEDHNYYPQNQFKVQIQRVQKENFKAKCYIFLYVISKEMCDETDFVLNLFFVRSER